MGNVVSRSDGGGSCCCWCGTTVDDVETPRPPQRYEEPTMSGAYAVRRAVDADQRDVQDALDLPDAATRKRFFGARASTQLGALIETAELALTATDAHRADRVLGFCALDDRPPPLSDELADRPEAFRAYLRAKYELPRPSTWLFLAFLALKQSSAASGAVLRQLLHAGYTALPHRACVLLVLPLSVELETDPSGLHKFFERVAPKPSTGGLAGPLDGAFAEFAVYQSRAADLLPSVHVRRARVEDHDDLEPILNAHNASVARQFGDYFLAELIKDQDAHNVCLVAEAAASASSNLKYAADVAGRAVGVLAISDEIHVAPLQQSFELDAYNNLAKSAASATLLDDAPATLSVAPKIVIAGPPAGGKGTQCELLVQAFGVVHLSTGDMLRASIQAGAPLGMKAQAFMDAGELVPDALIVDVVLARLAERDCVVKGWLLDGFPRTAAQAQAMVRLGLLPDAVVVLDVPDEEVVKRISGRRVDPETGKTYHLEFNPPPPQDEALRARLVQRSDDTEVTIRNRLTTFHANCDAVVDAFRRAACKVVRVDGLQPKQEIGDAVADELHRVKSAQKLRYLARRQHLAPPRLVITGPPAGGKGTQCEQLVELFGVVHLSTGDMLRASIQAGAALGRKAQAFMEAGELVPDELIIDVILARLAEPDCASKGWLLDGFPRTEAQAGAMLAAGVVPEAVLVLDVPDEEVVQRISGRRVDPVTGKTYHVTFNPPPPEARDRVVQRADDNETAIRTRLEKFHANGDAVLGAFADVGGVEIVQCDGLLPTPVVLQAFTAPLFQRMLDAEAAVVAAAAGHHTLEDHADGHGEDADGLGGPLAAARAAAQLWRRVEDARAQRNCFAITLFSMDDRFDARGALDLVAHAFAAFPDRDFGLLTLPADAAEPSFLRAFSRVPPRARSTFTHVLYLLHRDAVAFFQPASSQGEPVLDALELAVARVGESIGEAALAPLLGTVAPPARAELQDALARAHGESDVELEDNPKHVAFAVTVSSSLTETVASVVGLVVLARDPERSGAFKHFFQLDDRVLLAHHRAKDQALVARFVLNPVFAAAARFVLREAARLFRKSCLFYEVDGAAQDVSPVVHELVLAPPRRSIAVSRDEVAGYEDDAARAAQRRANGAFALFVASKKLLSEPKLAVNHRVVVVGASDAALVALQRLLTVPYLRFTNLTLVAPLGLALAPALEPDPLGTEALHDDDPLAFARKSALTAAELRQFSLETHVRVVESKLMQLDRAAKAVVLQDGSCLPYDFLVLATGLQDGTATTLGRFPAFDGDAYTPAPLPPKMVALGDVRTARWLRAQLETPAEKASSDRIAVYGGTLFALQVVQALLAMGVDGARIVHLSPARDAVFEDAQIRNEVEKEYAKRGVLAQYNVKVVSLAVRGAGDAAVLEGVHTAPAAAQGPAQGHSSNGQPSTNGQSTAPATTLVPCAWLLCCQHNDADYDAFRAINESGLVYDGRLVVNGHMRTTDAAVFAAGSLCRFSRRFIHAKLHEHYSARECGELLAAALLRVLDPLATPSVASASATDDAAASTRGKSLSGSSSAPSLGAAVSPTNAGANAVVPPPEMHLPVVRAARVVGGKHYVQISVPALTNTLALQVLPTRADARYTCLLFDDFGVLNRLEYLGDERVEVGNLACLVGLHESFLNSAVASFASAYVADWLAFFRQKWAAALYHDRFPDFCVRLHGLLKRDDGVRQLVDDVAKFFGETGDVKGAAAMAQVRVGHGGDALEPSTKRLVESQALEFLSANREVLTMYLLPRANGNGRKSKPGTATGAGPGNTGTATPPPGVSI